MGVKAHSFSCGVDEAKRCRKQDLQCVLYLNILLIMKVWKYLLPLIGICLLTVSFFFQQKTRSFLAQAVKADGVVIDLASSHSSHGTTYAPVVRFVSQDGTPIQFTSSSSTNPPSYRRGQKVQVVYNQTNPYEAKINSFMSLWGLPSIVGGIGALLLAISAAISLASTLGKRADDYLRRNGTPIQTDFQSVSLNTNLQVNGRSPFHIYTQWKDSDTSEVHVFHSKNIWYDPTQYIDQKQITVFVDRKNLKKYLMDVSFLPKLAD